MSLSLLTIYANITKWELLKVSQEQAQSTYSIVITDERCVVINNLIDY